MTHELVRSVVDVEVEHNIFPWLASSIWSSNDVPYYHVETCLLAIQNARMLNVGSCSSGSLFICVMPHFLLGSKPLFRDFSCTVSHVRVSLNFSGSILSKAKLSAVELSYILVAMNMPPLFLVHVSCFSCDVHVLKHALR